jgi:butyrate kinase
MSAETRTRILVVNPGSTSTKISVFEGENEVWKLKLDHSMEELAPYEKIFDQYNFRESVILSELEKAGYTIKSFAAIVGRGGVSKPIPGGTYTVNQGLLNDLESGIYGEHASNLGAPIASKLGMTAGCPAFMVDPVVVDELEPPARYSGHPAIRRRSIFHALNQRAVARKVAREMGKGYDECNFIVVHLGGGISVGAHRRGRVVDVNNALDGDGPFSPERSGGLPSGQMAALCFSGKYTLDQVKKMIKGQGGIVAYLNTNDMRLVEDRILGGDLEWREVYHAMAYQVAKEIGAMAAVLQGDIDAVIITGGIAYDKQFVGWMEDMTGFLAPMRVIPGEMEMEALATGALRVLSGQEMPRTYESDETGGNIQ